MQKKPKREIKYKNIFDEAQPPQQEDSNGPSAVPPPQASHAPVSILNTRPPIEHIDKHEIIQEPQRPARPAPVKPVPEDIRKNTTATDVPQRNLQSIVRQQLTNTHVIRNAADKPVLASMSQKQEVTRTEQVQNGDATKKRSIVEELKMKYLRKADPKPTAEQPSQSAHTSKAVEAIPRDEVKVLPDQAKKNNDREHKPVVSEALQHFLSSATNQQQPIAEKGPQVSNLVPPQVENHKNLMSYFKQDSLDLEELNSTHKQSLDSNNGEASPHLQIETELSSPFHRPVPTMLNRTPPPPPPLQVKPRREIGVYKQPAPIKKSLSMESPDANSSRSIEKISLFANQGSQHENLNQGDISPQPPISAELPIHRIKHTLSIGDSPVHTPKHEDAPHCFTSEVIPPASQNFTVTDLINNFPKLLDDILNERLIEEPCYQFIQTVVAQKSPANSTQQAIEPRTDTKIHFDFPSSANGLTAEELSSKWMRSFFQTFILYAKEIQPESEAFSYHFITSVFSDGELSDAFLISLIKTSRNHYSHHEEELLRNIAHCVRSIRAHKHWVSDNRIAEFVKFLLDRLRNYYSGDHYCKIFIEIAYSFPRFVLSNEQALTCFFRESQRFSYNALLFWLMTVNGEVTALKSFAMCLTHIIKEFEDKGRNEECLTLLDSVGSKIGSQAYPMLRELRGRVVSKIEAKIDEESKKNSKGGNVFGELFSQAIKFINKPLKAAAPPTKDQTEEPEEREDIYYDPEKKRYVLKGEIPVDEQEEREKLKQNVPPPPPPPRPRDHLPTAANQQPEQPQRVAGIPPPPPVRKGGNRIPQNRYVSS